MENFKLRGSNFCTSSGLLTATGADTVYDTTVTITYCINGKAATKTAVTDGVTPTTDYVSGNAITLTASCSGVWSRETVPSSWPRRRMPATSAVNSRVRRSK